MLGFLENANVGEIQSLCYEGECGPIVYQWLPHSENI